ncbi:MAG: hypothetical protein HN657_06110 [Candidatus Marinimicrobia bacterium]|jgi:hypothetical protein|nr:hypothetical protein [Candidatus Neomarinimicrobiota bacterium]MBT3496166.1 hypothetical protein [Candidatus Neomarinimicrobiota bacterium]MBT3692804.1 hypothetical protein [Candidatus Neomarinimicrobiota bacterium]MBT3731837.1 hypothetical protein [Candidatus Neomarinimicrobiota bacterium]MBT4145074.1 hypothetical protein [Candidatus Neomarinimicrobiota bacterium]
MKQIIIIPILFLMCFGQDEPTAIKDYYHYSMEDIERLETEIEFGLGTLHLSANEKPYQLDGSIYYSIKRGEPIVTMEKSNGVGNFEIEFENNYEGIGLFFNKDELNIDGVKNEMDFQFPKDIPTELELEFGLGEADIDLTDISISNFELECGMSDVKVKISEPNKIRCEKVSVEIGLTDFSCVGLGNLNANTYEIELGLGDADIDITGEFKQNAELEISVGLGSLDLVLPKNVNITLSVDHSFLASVDINGLKKVSDKKYKSKNWNTDFLSLDIEISLGLGDVNVRVER